MTVALPRRRSFFAFDLTIVAPIDTWPSPAMTTLPFLRRHRMVVPCQAWSLEAVMEPFARERDCSLIAGAVAARNGCGAAGGRDQEWAGQTIGAPRRRDPGAGPPAA